MYFNVFADHRSEVHGYLIPDGFSSKPRILVRANGDEIGPIDCDIFLESPYKHRHHETGVVGFILNDANVPGIGQHADLEIADAETGFTFYRRLRPGQHLEKRIFRLETQFSPHNELDLSLMPHFQFNASGIEHYGSETVRQMLEVVNQPSTYVSGRVLLKTVQQYFDSNTITITSLRDPFYELAIRLTTISLAKKRPFSFLSKRDEIIYKPAMEYFSGLNFADEKSLTSKIKSAPKDILTLFDSPFTRQLVAASPTDNVSRDAVSNALDVLSQFSIFNAEEKDDTLARDISDYLGFENYSLRFIPMRPEFKKIADMLRQINTLEHVLESDLILYYFIRKAAVRARKRSATHPG
ncbi:MAG: hypothetical protein EP348_08215 [Alphaproteobacteria bacterium]|nr:MAG: hypothetical protein EP348_08215 [Alphaproteobacteria bacterium]